jgi:histone H3/H4
MENKVKKLKGKKKTVPYIPKSVIRNHIKYVWGELIGVKHAVRIQKTAFITLQDALAQQLCECLRAAKRMIGLSKRNVVTAKDLYLARCLLFANIAKQVRHNVVTKPIADNACRELARSCKVSLSKKINDNPLRPYNTYEELRRLLMDLIYEIIQCIINKHSDDLSLIKESFVSEALRQTGLRKHYIF